MKVVHRKEAEQLLTEAAELNKQVEAALGFSTAKIREQALETSNSTAAVLSATIGGALGGVGAASLSHLIGYAVLATGPVGLVIGAALGVLLYRGPRYVGLERSLDKLDLALMRIRARLDELPADAPPEARETLWAAYLKLPARYTTLVESYL